jgi:hypothetical protein
MNKMQILDLKICDTHKRSFLNKEILNLFHKVMKDLMMIIKFSI